MLLYNFVLLLQDFGWLVKSIANIVYILDHPSIVDKIYKKQGIYG